MEGRSPAWPVAGAGTFYAAMGDAKQAAAYLPGLIDRTPFVTRKTVPLDPWCDKICGAPEFVALFKEPEAKK